MFETNMPQPLLTLNSGEQSNSTGTGQFSNNQIIKAQLPNQQRTIVSTTAGTTIRQALEKPLGRRKLEPDMCSVFRLSPTGQTKQKIDWDVDVTMLRGDEVAVETNGRVPMRTQLSHNFVKHYLTLTKCNFCPKYLLNGIKCLTCGITFHKTCEKLIPPLCEVDNNIMDGLRYRDHDNENSTRNSLPFRTQEFLEEKWEIDGDEITRGARIGQGSFATVYKGNWHGPVALKELNVRHPTPQQMEAFKHEVKILKRTRHANVLLFIGFVRKPNLIIVTQWCKGRSLYKHLHVEERREFTNCEIRNIAIGVAQGMEYLHAKGIIHRDLKSNNIFIHDEDDLTVKIGDFGLAAFKTKFDGDQEIFYPTGSILWMAPEVIRIKPGVNRITFYSDVYSYGIVLYELLSRKLPYFDFKHKEALLFLIGRGDAENSPKLNLDVIEPSKPEGLKALMLKCIERNPEDRPLFIDIIKDLRAIKLSRIPRSTSEPLRLNDLNGSFTLDTINY